MLALVAYDIEHYAIYLIVFSVVFLLSSLPPLREGGSWRSWLRLLLGLALTAAVFLSSFSYQLIRAHKELSLAGDYVTVSGEETVRYSADLLSFFIPGAQSRYFGGLFDFNTETSYLGWVVLVLAAAGFWSYRRRGEIRLFAVTAVIFALLALGPWVVVLGEETRIPGLAALIGHVPLLGSPRTPVRFVVMSALSLSVLAGYGVRAMAARIRGLSRRRWLPPLAVTIVALLFILEVRPVPVLTRLTAPPVYSEIAASPLPGSVVVLPLGWEATPAGVVGMQRGYPQIYQPVHQRPLVGGYVSRAPRERVLKHVGEPVLSYLSDPGGREPDRDDLDPDKIMQVLDRYDIAFIVVHKQGPEMCLNGEAQHYREFSDADLARIDEYVTTDLGMERFEDTDQVAAYRRPAAANEPAP